MSQAAINQAEFATESIAAPAPIVAAPQASAQGTALKVLGAISFCHLLNDTCQSLIPSLYPMLKSQYGLDYGHIGLLTLTFQLTASIFQPIVGLYTDKRPMPYSLVLGMGSTLVGLLLLAMAGTFPLLLLAAGLVGLGSSVFHPESSRVARLASGGRHGLAQSIFQVGGNTGSALGPLLAAFIILPHGQGAVAWFALVALAGMLVLSRVGRWYGEAVRSAARKPKAAAGAATLPGRRVAFAVCILLLLIFSKYFYLASLTNYYTFFLIQKFGLSVQQAQLCLFVELGAVALGTIVGGPVGDKVGRKYVIWGSILGVLPFTLALPYVNLPLTIGLSFVIGAILASAFSAILVYAQELMPGKIGTVSGLFFGFAFGMGGLGAAVLGELADHIGVVRVFEFCAFLPALGVLAAFLPRMEEARVRR